MNNNDDIVIVSTGCATALGPNALHTTAEVFAGNTVAAETPFGDHFGRKLTAAVLPRAYLPELPEEMENRAYFTRREGLLLRFATLALRDCLNDDIKSKLKTPPALFLALPEYETEKLLNPEELLDGLAALNPGMFQRPGSQANFRGRAGGLLALGAAIDSIKEGATFAIAGGVDTFYDVSILFALDRFGRIKTKRATDFFIPGEGAGFFVVTARKTAIESGLTPLGTIYHPVFDMEKGPAVDYRPKKGQPPDETPVGDALAGAIKTLFTTVKPDKLVSTIYSTMNGETYWGREWTVAHNNNAAFFDDNAAMLQPAEFYGDIGAASAPVMIALACFGLRENKHKPPILIYASSDKGERAATLLHYDYNANPATMAPITNKQQTHNTKKHTGYYVMDWRTPGLTPSSAGCENEDFFDYDFGSGSKVYEPKDVTIECFLDLGEAPKEDPGVMLPYYVACDILLMHDDLLAAILEGGADNLQVYPAVLRDTVNGVDHTNYKGVNIMGRLRAESRPETKTDKLNDSSGILPELVEGLVIDAEAPDGTRIFRLENARRAIIVHEKVKLAIEKYKIPYIWFRGYGEWLG